MPLLQRSLESRCLECKVLAILRKTDFRFALVDILIWSNLTDQVRERTQQQLHQVKPTVHLIQDPIYNTSMSTVDDQVGKNVRRRKRTQLHSPRKLPQLSEKLLVYLPKDLPSQKSCANVASVFTNSTSEKYSINLPI